MAEVLEQIMVHPCQRSSKLTTFIYGKDRGEDYSCFLSCENGVKLPKEASSINANCDWMNCFPEGKDTLPEMEKIYVTSEASQVELVTSPVLWECLQVIKSDSNFSDLSYRASYDLYDQEVLVVYRERVIRVFALPVEPISLILEPNGKCLLSIPFKPALRVTVANPSTGEVDRKALMGLLQMVSGKGYSFCPGIPEKFVMGKVCGKHVVLHRLPFKRFNAQGCPVYFQSQAAKTAHNKSNLRALCPRCLHISKWAQTLPFIRAFNPALALQQSALTAKTPLSDATKQQNARSFSTADSTSNDCMVVAVEKSEAKTTASGSSGSQRMTPTSPALAAGLNSGVLPEAMNKGSTADEKPNDLTVKLQSVSESLRQLIHARTKNRQTCSLIGDDHCKIPEDRKGKNVCKLCQKQFSSNLRLSKHVQRHEGSMRSIKLLQGRKAANAKFSDAVLKRWVRGPRFLTKNGKKGQGDISQTSLRMLLKCLDSVMEGRVKEEPAAGNETIKTRKRKREPIEESFSTQDGKIGKVTPVIEVNKISSDTIESEKPEAGFSALLAAAGIANSQSHPALTSSGNLYTSSSPVPSFIDKEFINADSSTRDEDSSGAEKKARKSPRLASKRAKATTKKAADTKEKSGEDGAVQHQHTDDSLTNLDLLSTVSVQAAAVAVLKPMINNSTVGASPTSRISQTSTLPFPTSHSGLNASPLPLRPNLSSNTAALPLPELIRISPENKSGNLPAIPPLTYVPPEEQRLLHPQSRAAASNFSPRSNPVVACPTEKVAPHHNIPMHLFEKDVSLSSSPISTETLHEASSQHQSSSKSDCGAMDLSKRKVPSCKVLGMTSQPNPSQWADSSKKNAADVIRRLLMINPQELALPPINRDPPSPRALATNKEADEDLQARIFASAKDYRVDNLKQSAGHVQTVVAPFSGPPSSLKQGKPLSTEIQCGYKWSGSGGLVKERTQMVKELVPSMVISDILSKPSGASSQKEDHSISATVTGVAKLKSSFGSSISRLYEPSEQVTPSAFSTKAAEPPVEPSVQNSAASCALNLSKSRSEHETHGRLTVLPSMLLSLSSVVTTTAATGTSLKSLRGQTTVVSSPSSPHSNVFRNSFRHPSPRMEQLPISVSQSSKESNISSSPRVLSLPIPVVPVSPISSASSPAPQSISSPSLAAILRQPPNPRMNQNSSGSGIPQATSLSANSLDTVNVWKTGTGGRERIQIKPEPFDHDGDGGDATARNFSAVVVKTESFDTSGSVDTDCGISKASSPRNVVVDMSSDKLSVSSAELESNSSVSSFSGLKIRASTRPTKCEYCSQRFASPTDSSGHVCPGFKS